MFEDFIGYIRFFLLEDLIDDKNYIKFYLPFDHFKTKPVFKNTDDYLQYKKLVMDFIKNRNKRIENYTKQNAIK